MATEGHPHNSHQAYEVVAKTLHKPLATQAERRNKGRSSAVNRYKESVDPGAAALAHTSL
jgi:hypothetical protein